VPIVVVLFDERDLPVTAPSLELFFAGDCSFRIVELMAVTSLAQGVWFPARASLGRDDGCGALKRLAQYELNQTTVARASSLETIGFADFLKMRKKTEHL
jgi:hypothetical protein